MGLSNIRVANSLREENRIFTWDWSTTFRLGLFARDSDMVRDTYWLKFEPTDSLYRRLIRIAVLEAELAYLVLPDGTVTPSVHNALEKLSVDEIARKTVREWPGTKLLGRDSATLIEYHCTSTLAHVMTSLTDRLYGWLGPDLPEDLGFIRSDGSVWLASTSHEKCAFLELSSEELSSLSQREPDFARILQTDDEPAVDD